MHIFIIMWISIVIRNSPDRSKSQNAWLTILLCVAVCVCFSVVLLCAHFFSLSNLRFSFISLTRSVRNACYVICNVHMYVWMWLFGYWSEFLRWLSHNANYVVNIYIKYAIAITFEKNFYIVCVCFFFLTKWAVDIAFAIIISFFYPRKKTELKTKTISLMYNPQIIHIWK